MSENVEISEFHRRILEAEEEAGSISAGRLRARSEDLLEAIKADPSYTAFAREQIANEKSHPVPPLRKVS